MYYTVTPTLLAGMAGSFISIVLMVLPLWPKWYEKWSTFTDKQRQALNALATVAAAVVIALFSCLTEVIFFECTQVGIVSLAQMTGIAILSNVGTYKTVDRFIGDSIMERMANR